MAIQPDDPRLQKCGFAKLLGPDIEYYVRKYEITIGRKSKSTALDVILGDNMNISRLHAKIAYNFDIQRFELIVLGKNGVTVKGALHTPNSAPVVLQSQDLIQIGESTFYFLLPKDLTKLRSTGKRKRRSNSASGATDARATTPYSEEEGYSGYDDQYTDDGYAQQGYVQSADPNNQEYQEEYEGEEEEYEEEPAAAAAAAPAYHGGHTEQPDDPEGYEDEDEDQYEEQIAPGYYA